MVLLTALCLLDMTRRLHTLPVLNLFSRLLVCQSPDFECGDEGLLDECEVVRTLDQLTIGQRYRRHSCTIYRRYRI
jgi:hypothetical protein